MDHSSPDNKFCKHCGEKIPKDAVICTSCGRQVEKLEQQSSTPQIVLNNSNYNSTAGMVGVKICDKWTSLVLCLFLGFFGAHKFYEGKTGIGILYLFTFGICGIGWFIDILSILSKPNKYYP